MTESAVVITGFIVLAVAIVLAVVTTHLRRRSWATLGETVRYLTRTRLARIVAVAVWAWLGWHFLAR
ncbi:DUF6186 family protein [Nocardia sp. NPDC052254]|uniref:DUF6186 family protein n=1 Tax=Nocardia sp. NPDC052254 TaxID=3155681 RepID=UPI003425CAD9